MPRKKRDTLPSPPPEAAIDGPELIKSLNEQWVKDGAQLPSPAVLQRLKTKLSLVETEAQSMMKRFERIRKERHDIALELVRKIGSKQAISIHGKPYIVTSRGGFCFYRPAGEPKGI